MSEEKTIWWLKICIGIGISLLLLGHYCISYAHLPEKMGVSGMIISASLIAFGLIFSLPTKMYLTFLLVTRENRLAKKLEQNTQNQHKLGKKQRI